MFDNPWWLVGFGFDAGILSDAANQPPVILTTQGTLPQKRLFLSMGNFIRFFLKLIFYYPGKIILWVRFMFPGKGKITVASNQYNKGGVALPFIFSCGFWFVLFVFVVSASTPPSDTENAEKAPDTAVKHRIDNK